MIVICLEGCHCVGKTELCEAFRAMNFTVQDEAFMDMPAYSLHPQSLMMETTWVCNWFSRILKIDHDLKSTKGNASKNMVIIADRSPYSAIFYCQNPLAKQILEPLIQAQIKELRQNAGIEVVTVHVSVETEVLWSRIQNRLMHEPFRRSLQEDKREWMEKVLAFYRNCTWDIDLDNTAEQDASLASVARYLLELVQEKLPSESNLESSKRQIFASESKVNDDSDEEGCMKVMLKA